MEFHKAVVELYDDGVDLSEELMSEEWVHSEPDFKRCQVTCYRIFRETSKCVDLMEIFHGNMTIDDIRTEDLQFLNIDYYLGRIFEYTYITPGKLALVNRASVVKATLQKHLDFLVKLDRLGAFKKQYNMFNYIYPDGIDGKMALSAISGPRKIVTASQLHSDTYKDVLRRKEIFDKHLRRINDIPGEDNVDRKFRIFELDYHRALSWQAVKVAAHQLEIMAQSMPANVINGLDLFNDSSDYIPTDYDTATGAVLRNSLSLSLMDYNKYASGPKRKAHGYTHGSQEDYYNDADLEQLSKNLVDAKGRPFNFLSEMKALVELIEAEKSS